MSTITAFDADVIIYAADGAHPFQRQILTLLAEAGAAGRGIGSVLLLPEVLSKPLRSDPDSVETGRLTELLGTLRLLPMDADVARLAVALGARYSLRAADAVHLATAVAAGADRFLTNNRKDFPVEVAEIDVIFPEQLS
ncbi:MAG: PIN domain-containing protein [Actinobacteria bacterium]|nr:PIN domain-containing protein [Actinomycetota bacterium]